MAKYNKLGVDKICSLIQTDSYTIPEICQQAGISESTYHEWRTTKPEFLEAIKKAQATFLESLFAEAKKSLMKKVRGYEVEEVKTVYRNLEKKGEAEEAMPKMKEQTKTTKHIQPDTVAIIFTLANLDSENWKNRQSSDMNGNITLSKPLSAQERKKIEEELNNEY